MRVLNVRFGRRSEDPRDALQRLEEKQRSAARATEHWLSLLREMEHNGESGDSRYESYYTAYLQARDQQKRIDLQVFNVRSGLLD